jgi:ABC-type Fe3+ transport system permease subunit
MELATILIVVFSFALVKRVLQDRSQVRADRALLMEKALQQPHLDRETLDGLAYQLTGRRARLRDEPSPGRRLRALMLALGWFTMFGGAATWIAGVSTHSNDAIQVGIILLVSGFAVTTYPFALRELEARRGVQ